MADLTTLITVALVLAVALFGMVTRLVVPVAVGWWRSQTAAAAAQVRVLSALPLAPRSAGRRGRHRANARFVARLRRAVAS